MFAKFEENGQNCLLERIYSIRDNAEIIQIKFQSKLILGTKICMSSKKNIDGSQGVSVKSVRVNKTKLQVYLNKVLIFPLETKTQLILI